MSGGRGRGRGRGRRPLGREPDSGAHPGLGRPDLGCRHTSPPEPPGAPAYTLVSSRAPPAAAVPLVPAPHRAALFSPAHTHTLHPTWLLQPGVAAPSLSRLPRVPWALRVERLFPKDTERRTVPVSSQHSAPALRGEGAPGRDAKTWRESSLSAGRSHAGLAGAAPAAAHSRRLSLLRRPPAGPPG